MTFGGDAAVLQACVRLGGAPDAQSKGKPAAERAVHHLYHLSPFSEETQAAGQIQ